jgi:hypothetical protein
MASGDRRLWLGFAAVSVAGVLLVLTSLGSPAPFDRVAGELPPSTQEDLMLVGLVALAVVALGVTGIFALNATIFLFQLAVQGRDALAGLPDVDPLTAGAIGVIVLAGIAGGWALYTGQGASDDSPAVSVDPVTVDPAHAASPGNPHGTAPTDRFDGTGPSRFAASVGADPHASEPGIAREAA